MVILSVGAGCIVGPLLLIHITEFISCLEDTKCRPDGDASLTGYSLPGSVVKLILQGIPMIGAADGPEGILLALC